MVLTGGPGAGKTAVLELCRRYFCSHVVILPEAASLLFAGGFPRGGSTPERAATQRAIYHVQRELECVAAAQDNAALVLCDRGTVDGAAYWPGPGSLFEAVGSSLEAELGRYDAVIHLRTPDPRDYTRDNPMRIETAEQAAAIDDAIAVAWRGHPRLFVVDSRESFLHKAKDALTLLADLLPPCCA
ncbi:MAG TPA: ATP-binding protein [Polyangiales bacterium]|nr:ATP-binding protein [Polyangiales bacterium]